MPIQSSVRHWSAFAGLTGVLVAAVSGCGGGGGGTPAPGGGGARDACLANTPTGHARWTVLIYMDAANNLQPFSLQNVSQLASVGSDANVNIVLQWKQTSASEIKNRNGSVTPSFIGTRRYFLRQHNQTDVTSIAIPNGTDGAPALAADRLADPATNNSSHQADMGDYRTLADFVQWGTRTYPADHIAVVIWDHGSGWQPVYRAVNALNSSSSRPRAVAQDDNTNNEIETQQLPLGFLGASQKVDVLIFDASLEQMTEVAYQMRNSARVMIGSEDSPPGAGYPYDKWITGLKASGKNPCDLGNTIIQTFVSNYTTQTDVTQSILDLSKMQNVATNLDLLGQSLYVHRIDQATVIANARKNDSPEYAVAENYAGYRDIATFAANVRDTTNQASLKQAATNLVTALTDSTNGAIIEAAHGSSQAGSQGLSIYIPSPAEGYDSRYDTDPNYGPLALAQAAPNWVQFLKDQTQ